jgi:tRNA (cmo5U34)-methyltransferase
MTHEHIQTGGETMTAFSNSNWARADFAKEYRDGAEVFVIARRRLFTILQSFYRHFMKGGRRRTMLDLGCGDGIVSQQILEVDRSVSATLLDGSEDMLNKARERLSRFENVQYMCASFQNLLDKNILNQGLDFAISSLAIHHLKMDDKRRLFERIYSVLNPGGFFVNIDVVLSPSNVLDGWFMLLWKEWIMERKSASGIKGDYYEDIIRRYRNNKDNKPDTLDDQLNALKAIGYRDVDCLYKYGVFTMYGGRKKEDGKA